MKYYWHLNNPFNLLDSDITHKDDHVVRVFGRRNFLLLIWREFDNFNYSEIRCSFII